MVARGALSVVWGQYTFQNMDHNIEGEHVHKGVNLMKNHCKLCAFCK